MTLRILQAGLQTTIQDRGRYGLRHLGVGTAGPMDADASAVANLLVGNLPDAALLEITLHGPRLRAERDCVLAIAGGEIAAHCSDRDVPIWRPFLLRAGAELTLGNIHKGTRCYLAIAGGIAVAEVLGSRSQDVNAGLGPFDGRPLKSGGQIESENSSRRLVDSWIARHAAATEFAATPWSVDPTAWFDRVGDAPIRIVRGSHFDRLDAASQGSLVATPLRIASESNRVGYRLTGGKLILGAACELISAGVTPGTIQLPPSGEPIVLMAEAPTTGGYPRIAHVIAVDLPRLAQRRPGDAVSFVLTDLHDAQTRYRERALSLERLRLAIEDHWRTA